MELQTTRQALDVIWLILTAALNEAWELRTAISIRLLTIDLFIKLISFILIRCSS